MKSKEQKLQHVMEAVGECYHIGDKAASTGDVLYDLNHNVCKCGEVIRIGVPDSEANPSPDDLNTLFRLAEKLGIYAGHWKIDDCGTYHVLIYADMVKRPEMYQGETLAKAILQALFIATGGKDE